MTRQQVYNEIKQTLGLVPSFLKAIPDSSLEQEWELFKVVPLGTTAIPNKYKDLMGLAIAATTKCQYCTFFHTAMAKLNGATDEEVEDAVHYAKATAGWSAYINGLQIDFDQFKQEIEQIGEYLRSQADKSSSVSAGKANAEAAQSLS